MWSIVYFMKCASEKKGGIYSVNASISLILIARTLAEALKPEWGNDHAGTTTHL